MPLQVVMDTSVLVAAARSNSGASFELLRLFAAGDTRWQWNISTALLVEYEAVLLSTSYERIDCGTAG